MSLKKYLNNAWTEITQLKKYLSSAWQDCEFARKYENSAWVDVWTNGVKGKLGNVSMVGGATYDYSVSTDGTSLTFNIYKGTSTASSSSQLPFIISKAGGFGTTIKIKFTITQTMSSDKMASTGWLDMTFARLGNSGAYYLTSSVIDKTYEVTITLSENQTYLYFLVEAYGGNTSINGTIKDVYINDELVTFE